MYLTTGQAARLLGCSQQLAVRMCERGVLKYHCVPGSKHRRIHPASLLEAAEASGMPIVGDLKALADSLDPEAGEAASEPTEAATGAASEPASEPASE